MGKGRSKITVARFVLSTVTFLAATLVVLRCPPWFGSLVVPAFACGFLLAVFVFVLPDLLPRALRSQPEEAQPHVWLTQWIWRIRNKLAENPPRQLLGVYALTWLALAASLIAFLDVFVLVCTVTSNPFPYPPNYPLATLCGLFAAICAGRSIASRRPQNRMHDELLLRGTIPWRIGRFVRTCIDGQRKPAS